MTIRDAAALAVLSAAASLAAGCHRDGCVGGDDGTCLPPSACSALSYGTSCASQPVLSITMLDGAGGLAGPKARGAAGDFLLANDRVSAVVSGLANPSDLALTGGAIIDLAPAGGSGDQVNSIFQAAGLLPRDAVHYESQSILQGDSYVAVVFRGHLEGDRRVTVVTRYELRPCEPGVRVRSDLYNGSSDPNTLYLADGLFWGDHAAAPFVPGVGLGFRAPKLDLIDVANAWREWPFVAARAQAPTDPKTSYAAGTPAPGDASYAIVPCDPAQSAGFNDPTLTASGVPLTTTLPGDGIHLERFIIAAPGPGLAPAVDEALRARSMVHGEAVPVTVSGRVVVGGTPFDGRSGRAASLLFYEPAFGPDPDDPARRKPWSEAVPDADGRFSLALPAGGAGRTYRVQPYAFGLPAGPAASFLVQRDDVDIGDITLTASAHLIATVVTTPGQTTPDPTTYAELVVVPMSTAPGAEPPSLYGLFPGCNPMLGPPHGGSPACNRALTTDGRFDLLIPPGQYYVYATRGPFATIDRAEITVGPGDETPISLLVQSLSILPPGVFSGDFHVHGAASFDSSIPDQDRVVSFLTSGVDLVVATDHDVVTSYDSTLDALGASDRLVVISGTEQTPNIPWFVVPGEDLPKTLGHFNFWPLTPDPTLPRNGAPWDELREPGQMMDDVEAHFSSEGVRQLNHPFAESKLERDQGFLRAIGYDPRTRIVPGKSFAADVLLRSPGGMGARRNLDWDVQEVMTGSSPADWLRYRALWFSLLSQRILRAGTANSDTHSLSLGQVGYPRNLVYPDPNDMSDANLDPHDVVRFDDHVRRGLMIGTTGPVLSVTITDPATTPDGKPITRVPVLQPITVSKAAQLNIVVSAAPWIPVTEVRVIVNGVVVKSVSNLAAADHFATQIASATRSFPLASLLEKVPADAWLIVEAGSPLDPAHAVDGDGLPVLSDADLRALSDPALADYHAIVPGAWPVAFSNPFLLDLDGGGWQAPGLP